MLIRESVGLAKQRAQAPRLLLTVGFNFLNRRWSTPFGNKRHHYDLHIQQKCVSIRLRAKRLLKILSAPMGASTHAARACMGVQGPGPFHYRALKGALSRTGFPDPCLVDYCAMPPYGLPTPSTACDRAFMSATRRVEGMIRA